MLYRIVAAFLLIPASFVIYDNVLTKLMTLGARRFFSYTAGKAPSLILKEKFLHNVFIYYPMRVAIDLLHERNIIFFAKKFKKILKEMSKGEERTTDHAPQLENISIDRICSLIKQPTIRVVSFNILDTLLLRPVFDPNDIFHLIAKKVDQKYSIDFCAIRKSAQEKLKNKYSSLEEIYKNVQVDYGLSNTVCKALYDAEIECERALLQQRKDIYCIYEQAVKSGKRIIAISDIHLPSAILKEILSAKGFSNISEIYVSCEQETIKNDGSLYDVVLSCEKVPAEAIVHIGASYHCDFCKAVEKGIVAICYPSILEIAKSSSSQMWDSYAQAAHNDPLLGMLIVHSLNEIYTRPNPPARLDKFDDICQFCRIMLGPLTTGICLTILNNDQIQQSYHEVFFASRDGWLPRKVYEILRSHAGGLKSSYFYAGRRSYLPFICTTLEACAMSLEGVDNPDRYTFEQFIRAHVGKHADKILSHCSQEEKQLNFFRDRERISKKLAELRQISASVFAEIREAAQKYYDRIFNSEFSRCVCFDIGYSGSISRALSAITGKPVDKIYCWENSANKKFDRVKQTKTFTLMKNIAPEPYNLILEELFSPLEGGVVGFDNDGSPVFEEFLTSPAFENDMRVIEATVIQFASTFSNILQNYLDCFEQICLDSYTQILQQYLKDSVHCNTNIFKNISFSDPLYCSAPKNLAQKIESAVSFQTVFTGTGFENSSNIIDWLPISTNNDCKIGLHLHIISIDLIQECLRYLQYFPFDFSLYITTPLEERQLQLSTMFCPALLPKVEQVTVVPVPNRGRDIAPWLIEFGKVHQQYDLCCHISTMESKQFNFGAALRKYLFDNLIRSESAQIMITAMQEDSNIGCIFPSIYRELKQFMVSQDIPLLGFDGEDFIIKNVLQKLAINSNFCRNEIFFSAGAMMWYRPRALHQMFGDKFTYNDFLENQNKHGGTLSHVVERISSLVALHNGYTVKSLTRHP